MRRFPTLQLPSTQTTFLMMADFEIFMGIVVLDLIKFMLRISIFVIVCYSFDWFLDLEVDFIDQANS